MDLATVNVVGASTNQINSFNVNWVGYVHRKMADSYDALAPVRETNTDIYWTGHT